MMLMYTRYTRGLPDFVGFSQLMMMMMMMILRNLVAVWARTRRSMGEPYLRGREFATR